MRKLKFVAKKIKDIQFKNMNRVLNREASLANKSKFRVKLDFMYCVLKYKIGYTDYMKGHYTILNKNDRKKMITTNNYFNLLKYLNPLLYRVTMDDKLICNKVYHKYIKRDFIDLRICNVDDFKKFVKGKTNVFAKLIDSFGGNGVEKIKVSEIDNYEKLIKRLLSQRQYLIEEEIKQHDYLNKINKYAVNNIRIITILKDNKVHILERVLRINDGMSDTISCHDIQGRLDNDGNLISKMVDDDLNVFEAHPVTGFKFEGLKIPFMNETFKMLESAAKEVPNIRFIGWDIAITPTGPEIIEVNPYPCYTNYQYYLMHEDNKKMNYLEQIFDILGSEKDDFKL